MEGEGGDTSDGYNGRSNGWDYYGDVFCRSLEEWAIDDDTGSTQVSTMLQSHVRLDMHKRYDIVYPSTSQARLPQRRRYE